ncbi:MAG: hypothetical protein ABIG44_02575, partial [Planctomycetota bacterium]
WAPVASVAIELVDEGSVAKPEPLLAKLGLLAVRSPSGNWYIVIPDHKTVSACVRPFEYQVQKRYARAKHELFSVESIRKAMEQRETAQKPSHRSAGENRQADSNTRSAEIAKLLEQLPVKDKTPLLTKLKARSGGNVFNELTPMNSHETETWLKQQQSKGFTLKVEQECVCGNRYTPLWDYYFCLYRVGQHEFVQHSQMDPTD